MWAAVAVYSSAKELWQCGVYPPRPQLTSSLGCTDTYSASPNPITGPHWLIGCNHSNRNAVFGYYPGKRTE